MVGALLKNGAVANELVRATGTVAVGLGVEVGGTLVLVAVGGGTVTVGGCTVALGATCVAADCVAVAKVAGVSVTGCGTVGTNTDVFVWSTVGNTNGVAVLIGRLQAVITIIRNIPSK